jgi:hypothetical protein
MYQKANYTHFKFFRPLLIHNSRQFGNAFNFISFFFVCVWLLSMLIIESLNIFWLRVVDKRKKKKTNFAHPRRRKKLQKNNEKHLNYIHPFYHSNNIENCNFFSFLFSLPSLIEVSSFTGPKHRKEER